MLKFTTFIFTENLRVLQIVFQTVYLIGDLDPVYKWNFVKFSIDFLELENLEVMSLGWALGFRFSNKL